MSQVNVVRAWKDEEYRLSLTEAERAALPENPAGLIELAEAELGQAAGGYYWFRFIPSCPIVCITPVVNPLPYVAFAFVG